MRGAGLGSGTKWLVVVVSLLAFGVLMGIRAETSTMLGRAAIAGAALAIPIALTRRSKQRRIR